MKKTIRRIVVFLIIFTMLSPVAAFAVTGTTEQIKYIYFENANSEIVIVDYMQAMEAALNGDSVLYDSIKAFVGLAEANGTKIVLETDTGKILDYQKALVQNKSRLVDMKDDISYIIAKPVFTQELKVVGGTAAIVPAVAPNAPVVTNNDVLNTVSGMMSGMEYSLDAAPYIAYNPTAFAALNFAGSHTLLVRVAAAGTTPASTDTSLLFTVDPLTPAAPAVTNDDTLNTVTGMAAGMEYSLDGAPYITYSQTVFAALNFVGAHTLLVRFPAAGINPVSPETTLIFTTNSLTAVEKAEIAVSAYETALINSLTQITSAESLKSPADSAAAAVTSITLKAAFTLRISNRAAVIAAAKASLLAVETIAQTNAETAVTALENAPIANIAQINTASGLKTTAETKVALVGDTAAKAAFTARISVKALAMAIAEINLQTYYGSMDQLFTKYVLILGLDLTEYNKLANKTPVQTSMLAPVFTTATEIKTALDLFVAQQKATESSVMGAFNNAPDEAAIATAITTHAASLSLGLTEYNALTAAGKLNVQAALLIPTFLTGEEIKTAFVIAVMNNTTTAGVKTLLSNNSVLLGLGITSEYTGLSTKYTIENAIIAARPIADKTEIVVTAFNSTVLSGYIGQLLPINSTLLGLDLTDYNSLIFRNKMKVHDALMAETLNNAADLQTVFNASVATQKAFETAAVAAFNSATDDASIAAAITAYVDAADLGGYTALAYKVPVQEALLGPVFLMFSDVKAIFDTAVATQTTAQSTAMTAISNVATTASMSVEIVNQAQTLGLDLSIYNTLSDADKIAVQTAMITPTFYSVTVLQTTFNTAVANQNSAMAVNAASAAAMGSVITANSTSLGLNLSDYNLLPAASKDIVHIALSGKAFADNAAVVTAFETAVSVLIINEITADAAMGTAITRYKTVLGLAVTDYGSLTAPYKTTVHTALMSPVFISAAGVKATFDAAVASAKETIAVAAINNASTAVMMNTVIITNTSPLGLILTDYNALANKLPVQTALLAPTFTTAAEVKAAFDLSVAIQEINEAAADMIGAKIVKDAAILGLDLSDYNALINKAAVHSAMVSPVFSTATELQTAFNAATASQKAIEAPLLTKPGVALNKTTLSMASGSNETLTATVLPADAPNKDVIWSSDNETVATVDSTGKITGVDAGTAVITVTTANGGYKDTCTVTVFVSVTGVTLNKTALLMLVGTTETLTATIAPDNATNTNLIWTTDRPAVATVDSNGTVTAVASGIAAVITVTTEDGSYKATCYVRPATEAMAANAITQAIFQTMASTIDDYSAILGLDRTVYNALSDYGKSLVQSALLNPVFTNAAQVRAAFDAAVIAAKAVEPILVTAINVTGHDGSAVVIGNTLQMLAEVLPIDATDNTVFWIVDPGTGAAEIDPNSGLLTPTAEGTVLVTAYANDVSGVFGTLVVTITAP